MLEQRCPVSLDELKHDSNTGLSEEHEKEMMAQIDKLRDQVFLAFLDDEEMLADAVAECIAPIHQFMMDCEPDLTPASVENMSMAELQSIAKGALGIKVSIDERLGKSVDNVAYQIYQKGKRIE